MGAPKDKPMWTRCQLVPAIIGALLLLLLMMLLLLVFNWAQRDGVSITVLPSGSYALKIFNNSINYYNNDIQLAIITILILHVIVVMIRQILKSWEWLKFFMRFHSACLRKTKTINWCKFWVNWIHFESVPVVTCSNQTIARSPDRIQFEYVTQAIESPKQIRARISSGLISDIDNNIEFISKWKVVISVALEVRKHDTIPRYRKCYIRLLHWKHPSTKPGDWWRPWKIYKLLFYNTSHVPWWNAL